MDTFLDSSGRSSPTQIGKVNKGTRLRFERDVQPITKTVDLAIHELGRRLGVDVDSIVPQKPAKKSHKK